VNLEARGGRRTAHIRHEVQTEVEWSGNVPGELGGARRTWRREVNLEERGELRRTGGQARGERRAVRCTQGARVCQVHRLSMMGGRREPESHKVRPVRYLRGYYIKQRLSSRGRTEYRGSPLRERGQSDYPKGRKRFCLPIAPSLGFCIK
jgi:hypothetical protein